jgi:hypothetical protein
MNDSAQNEIERLKREIKQLQKALAQAAPTQPPLLQFITDDVANLTKNFEFLTDCARYAEGLVSKEAVKKKYRFSEATWVALGSDDALVEKIEAEKVRRIRDGSAKRERAQQLVVEAPAVLGNILRDEKASAKHRIDSAKVLDAFAANGPTAAPELERFVISINLGADYKLTFDKGIRPNPHDDGVVTVIDNTQQDLATIAERENDGSL